MVGDVAHVQPGGKVVDVSGNVRLQGEAGVAGRETPAVMHTDTLRYDVPDGVATTKDDVRIDFAGHTLTARGLVANLKERTLRLRIEGQWPLSPLGACLPPPCCWLRSHCRPARWLRRIWSSRPSCWMRRSAEMDLKSNNVFITRVRISQGNMSVVADQGQGNGLDFDNSHWVFRGNVEINMEQGQLISDEADLTFAKKLLAKAVVNGKPAAFEQHMPRPESWRADTPTPSTTM